VLKIESVLKIEGAIFKHAAKKEMVQLKYILSFAALLAYVGANEDVLELKERSDIPSSRNQIRQNVGDSCGDGYLCDEERGLICTVLESINNPPMTGTCQKNPRHLGQTCGGKFNLECVNGLTCINSKCQLPQPPQPPKSKKGGVCGQVDNQIFDCERGLQCYYKNNESGKCIMRKKSFFRMNRRI